jgi:N-acetylmuramoyl-L-alanine amidase
MVSEKRSGKIIDTNDLCAVKCKLNAIFAKYLCIYGMPATKLMKIRKALKRQKTKISGARDILVSALLMAAITMPVDVWSQPLPGQKEWVVVIDAGHGGKDPGTIGSASREKNIALAVALKTGKYIKESQGNVKVIYTRDNDTFLGLDERSEVANRNKADIFISIHANGIDDKRPAGSETWVLGQSMDEANLKLAMKENSVITFEKDYQTKYEGYDPNSVESFIIFSLMQNTYLKQSTEFASMIQDQFRERAGRKDRGVKQAGFVVLWRSTMPSVLVELGFLSNPEEEKYLMSEKGQDYLASAIFRAFRDYKHTIDTHSGVTAKSTVVSAAVPSVVAKDTVKPAATIMKTAAASAPAPAPAVKETAAKPATLPDEIFFMVQIAAMPNSVDARKYEFRGIETVTMLDAGERIKYGAGHFRDYEDAMNYRRTLTSSFPDAFVIAVREGKIIPLKEAIESKENKKQ